jgi:TonB family protein
MRLGFAVVLLLASCGGEQAPAETPKVDVAIPVATPIDAGSNTDPKIAEVVDAGAATPTRAPLGSAAVPFAHYAVAMHNRIHPIFTDQFMASLDKLPPTDPMNDKRIATTLEIVLDRDGSILQMGVVKTSGITAFDMAALDSVQRAGPFGKAPDAILSYNGHVYMRWEFHRDPTVGCSTMNTLPIMLRPPTGP